MATTKVKKLTTERLIEIMQSEKYKNRYKEYPGLPITPSQSAFLP